MYAERDIVIPIPSVRPFVCPIPALSINEFIYCDSVLHSSVIRFYEPLATVFRIRYGGGHFCRKIYGSSRSSTCVPSVWSSGYAGMTLSETQKLSTEPAFPVFGMSSPGDETHCSAMWWDSMTTRQLTAHYHSRISKNRLPFWSWLAATARTPAPFMDPTDRWRYTLQHSCWMVQGSSSWPLWVDATDLCCLHDLMTMMMMMGEGCVSTDSGVITIPNECGFGTPKFLDLLQAPRQKNP